MITLSPVDKGQLYRTFMEAFADYAMDASRTTEDGLLLRAAKNAVDFEASAGAYDGDRLVGFTLIGVDEWGGSHTAFGAGTGVVPAFRRQGLAKAMFDHALPRLRSCGVSRFLLEVLQENEPAIKAYRKSGFSTTRELRCFTAETAALRTLPESCPYEIRPIPPGEIPALRAALDWLPSFENRLDAVERIPTEVRCLGVFEEKDCLGGIAYVPALNWLLTLAVHPSHRRRGIGTTLLRRLAHDIPESIPRLPALNIDGEDAGMRAFLVDLGFSPLVDQFEMAREI